MKRLAAEYPHFRTHDATMPAGDGKKRAGLQFDIDSLIYCPIENVHLKSVKFPVSICFPAVVSSASKMIGDKQTIQVLRR